VSSTTTDDQTGVRIVRSTDDRVVVGVAAGVAAQLGVSAAYVRAALVVLSFAGGFGLAAYAVAWIVSKNTGDSRSPARTTSVEQRIGLLAMFLALLLFLRGIGMWFGDTVVWPVFLVSLGLAVTWDQNPRDNRLLAWVLPGGDEELRPGFVRIGLGAGLMVAGVAMVVSSVDLLSELGTAMLAVLITGGGLILVFGPWIWRLIGQLRAERTDRIRADERGEVAAHLHDSVLQTLALIQRAKDPKKMVTLARAQERELRDWLYDRGSAANGQLLSAALQSLAARVEADYDVPVELVTVGDAGLSIPVEALLNAAGEAIANAARHSQADRVSVYLEANESQVDLWVADQGSGFDLTRIDADRHGISESIEARLDRHGGVATITTQPGEGTEVHLSLPIEATRKDNGS